jgi:hypothetical protein
MLLKLYISLKSISALEFLSAKEVKLHNVDGLTASFCISKADIGALVFNSNL